MVCTDHSQQSTGIRRNVFADPLHHQAIKKEDLEYTDAQLLRHKAEEKLVEKSKTVGIPKLETDVKRLLHELQVHQIELEMQNEELRQANEVAESALRKFTLLYDFAPMGYFTLDQDGII